MAEVRGQVLGVKIQSDVSGTIHGIRFYKAAANTGVHFGGLWTSSGTPLAMAAFSNETASGWQQVFFATPVSIASNTVYVASYYANNGHYSADANYFTGKGVDNPPLHALTNGVFGGNGVYKYGRAVPSPIKLQCRQLLGRCDVPSWFYTSSFIFNVHYGDAGELQYFDWRLATVHGNRNLFGR